MATATEPLLYLENNLLNIAMTALKISVSKAESLFVTKQKTRIISLEELSFHDRLDDCWIVLYDRVYDITEFLTKHPGGSEILLEYAGRDATIAFRGAGHIIEAVSAINHYQVGELPANQKMWKYPSSNK